MNISLPRKSTEELLLFIWKIIDLPNISINDLLYKISFELFLQSPEEALEFIQHSIKRNLLKKDDKDYLKLSQNLDKKLKNWQLERKNIISSKFNSSRKIDSLIVDLKAEKGSDFSTLIKAFLDKNTINRAANLSDEAFKINALDFDKGLIKAEVAGSKKEYYIIEIDTKNKILYHNCNDFETRRAENKKFCKHIAKLFLLLKEKNERNIVVFLNKIAENINDWEFSS
ncbi:MAG: hypothetical protein ACFFDO_00705 [Candidatus Thorarchaeota archaeon]